MNKLQALTILINSSYFLTAEAKAQLLPKINQLSEQEVDAVGRFLALEKKKSIEAAPADIHNLEEMISILEADSASLPQTA